MESRKILESLPNVLVTSQTTSPPSWSRIGAIKNLETDSSPLTCSTIVNLEKSMMLVIEKKIASVYIGWYSFSRQITRKSSSIDSIYVPATTTICSSAKFICFFFFVLPGIFILRNWNAISLPRDIHRLVTASLTNQGSSFALPYRKSYRFFAKMRWS